jgi:hypothetical protein
VRVVRRGVFIREVYLYRGTTQICPFPFDGRFRSDGSRVAAKGTKQGRG